jgi:UDP-glucose 4-epimerase
VIASTGSVLPKLRSQARAGQPLTVTNPEMTRFWLSPQDALNLVDMALDLPNGLVLVPQPGASTIRTAIEAAIGCDLEEYIHGVTYITRPGEKASETMFTDAEYLAAAGPEFRDLRGVFAFEPLGIAREPLFTTYATSADPLFWWTREAIAEAIAEAELI